eukprot:snap_masked-scaffold_19-processed-gene-3.10-mRNA-1 protein AED:1.00 eAED:1.00 QI:0/-1/0/0/-1/1/1/0/343
MKITTLFSDDMNTIGEFLNLSDILNLRKTAGYFSKIFSLFNLHGFLAENLTKKLFTRLRRQVLNLDNGTHLNENLFSNSVPKKCTDDLQELKLKTFQILLENFSVFAVNHNKKKAVTESWLALCFTHENYDFYNILTKKFSFNVENYGKLFCSVSTENYFFENVVLTLSLDVYLLILGDILHSFHKVEREASNLISLFIHIEDKFQEQTSSKQVQLVRTRLSRALEISIAKASFQVFEELLELNVSNVLNQKDGTKFFQFLLAETYTINFVRQCLECLMSHGLLSLAEICSTFENKCRRNYFYAVKTLLKTDLISQRSISIGKAEASNRSHAIVLDVIEEYQG